MNKRLKVSVNDLIREAEEYTQNLARTQSALIEAEDALMALQSPGHPECVGFASVLKAMRAVVSGKGQGKAQQLG
jgi:hypothetical protein